MDGSPKIVGVMLVLAATGGGALIGSTPPMLQAEQGTALPDPRLVPPPRSLDRPEQNQYAIFTPQGRYEVDELPHRGLYSQPRFERYEAYDAYTEQDYIEVHAGHVASPQVDPAAPPIAEGQVEPKVAEPNVSPTQPEENAEPPGQDLAAASPRIVDVAAELAARR